VGGIGSAFSGLKTFKPTISFHRFPLRFERIEYLNESSEAVAKGVRISSDIVY
jgi:hypothetical protein